jgi:hypothetical protein
MAGWPTENSWKRALPNSCLLVISKQGLLRYSVGCYSGRMARSDGRVAVATWMSCTYEFYEFPARRKDLHTKLSTGGERRGEPDMGTVCGGSLHP